MNQWAIVKTRVISHRLTIAAQFPSHYNPGMCGRYTLRRINWYRDVKGMLPADFEEFTEKVSFNIAPSQLVPIITNEESGDLKVQKASWGFVPHWAKDKDDVKLKPINAKGETVATSGMFRDAFKRRRCLIPTDGFYEWQGAKPPKIPYFIHMRDDSAFCFGGIRSGDTVAIITTTPNAVLQPIHNRMPVIIAPGLCALAWRRRCARHGTSIRCDTDGGVSGEHARQ